MMLVVFVLLLLYLGIVLNYCQYGVLYLGSYYNTGPYIHFSHFGNSHLGKLPFARVHKVHGKYAQGLHCSCRALREIPEILDPKP